MKNIFLTLIILVILTVPVSADENWKVKSGDQFYYSLRYSTANLEKSMTLRVKEQPSVNNTSYLEYTKNSLSQYLLKYLKYFVIPVTVDDGMNKIDYREKTRNYLYVTYNISLNYNNLGVVDIFQILDDGIVSFEIVLSAPTNSLKFPIIYPLIVVLPFILQLKKEKRNSKANTIVTKGLR